MLRLLRLRRSVSPPTSSSSRASATHRANGPGNGNCGTAAASKRFGRRRRVQCLLVLHATWLAALMLLTTLSICGRQISGRQLADRLLHDTVGGGTAGPGFGGSSSHKPVIPASAHLCGEALQVPQVRLRVS